MNTDWKLVDSNTASVKCERVCESGYKLNATKTACEPSNLCGGNSNNYPASTSVYSATFCIAGATSSPTAPAFPKAGETVTWKCTLGTNTTECHASRANLEPGVCKNN